jgi:hypothetical protein
LGVVEDQSGLYADATGTESNLAAQMAVEESGIGGRAEDIYHLDKKAIHAQPLNLSS